jgi:glycosidase
MTFQEKILSDRRPSRLSDLDLPRRLSYYPSPVDWRNEIIYQVMIDRFSDGEEEDRPLLDRTDLPAVRGAGWDWHKWATSGAYRWQGGTLNGVRSKLGYLSELGVSTLWLSPVFRQRDHLDTYHGYAVQDFLEVDPHFGTRADLVALVEEAHDWGMRVILNIVFNHSGPNWIYAGHQWMPPYRPFPGYYEFGHWLDREGNPIEKITRLTDGVFPEEFQNPFYYTRAGAGELGSGNPDDPQAELRRSDFYANRDFDLGAPGVLRDLAKCYKYWIALTDCDGFCIDALRHVPYWHARNFGGTIKEYAANLGKENFFLVGEIAGGDLIQDRYLDAISRNIDAALDIGEMRPKLIGLAKGLAHPKEYFGGFEAGDPSMGSHRNLGNEHVSILDDHDQISGDKLRFSSDAVSDHQVVAGVAIQLFTLGIPCIYYGTEQAFAGPEPSCRAFLPSWNGGDNADRYLREAMFGPEHARRAGIESMETDPELPGFGPFGTAGFHCFDKSHPAFRRISRLTALRQSLPVLRRGRQYLRPIALPGLPYDVYGEGELLAWSRILDDEEALCIVNVNGLEPRGARILVDGELSGKSGAMKVMVNTMEVDAAAPPYPTGTTVPVKEDEDGTCFVELWGIGPSEGVVLCNH